MKLFRKQVLKQGNLSYLGSTIPITAQYLDEVVNAFNDSAMGSVPFQMADASNNHTEDPERRRGTVRALHRTKEGLDATIELDDTAAAMVQNYPDFGVSVLIKHSRETGEGKFYPAVLAHVLGTLDPVLTTLEPWREEIAASHSGRSDLLTPPLYGPWIGLAQPTQENDMTVHYRDYNGRVTGYRDPQEQQARRDAERIDRARWQARLDYLEELSPNAGDFYEAQRATPYTAAELYTTAELEEQDKFLAQAREEMSPRTSVSWRDHSAKGSDLQNRADERAAAHHDPTHEVKAWAWGNGQRIDPFDSERTVVYRGQDPEVEDFVARAREQLGT